MDNPSLINILLVDDNEMVRRSLSLFLSTQDGYHIVGEAANGSEAVQFCEDLNPDVILMDIKMPIMNGIEATKIIRRKHPEVCILALTSLEDNGLAKEVIVAGADSYLEKTASIDDISSAIGELWAQIWI